MNAAGPFDFLSTAALYGLSLATAAAALLAWPLVPAPALAALLAGAAVATVIVGEAAAVIGGDLQRVWRSRGRLLGWLLYAGLVAFAAMVAAAVPEPALFARQAVLFALLQPAFVAVATALGDPAPALVNALVLVVLAGLRGGTVAAFAAVAALVLATLFFTGEHSRRVLAAYGARRAPGLGAVLGEWARLTGPAVAALVVWMALLPPQPSPRVRWGPAGPPEDLPKAAYALLSIVSLVGAGIIGMATRLFRQRRRGEAPADEVLEAVAVEEETLAAAPPRAHPPVPGRRGRVVRAYARFLEGAARRGRPRGPASTAAEFVSSLGAAAGTAHRLTALFGDARYGREEPDEDTARLAEGLVEDAVREVPPGRARRAS